MRRTVNNKSVKCMFSFFGFLFVAAFTLSAQALTPVQYCEYLQAKTPGATEILNRTPNGSVFVSVGNVCNHSPTINAGYLVDSEVIKSCVNGLFKVKTMTRYRSTTVTFGCTVNLPSTGGGILQNYDVWHCTSGDCS